eukprot:TRINITY_DN12398_c0_g1_i1.p1 TRINITY_DN12398_c0_g1~~TRINITY_DN12398_c0_g1_i1.p1  ORF type:complete len:110 (-),score=15.03 TRINITY_DN12398_c0_g1_i1:65-394(-)
MLSLTKLHFTIHRSHKDTAKAWSSTEKSFVYCLFSSLAGIGRLHELVPSFSNGSFFIGGNIELIHAPRWLFNHCVGNVAAYRIDPTIRLFAAFFVVAATVAAAFVVALV